MIRQTRICLPIGLSKTALAVILFLVALALVETRSSSAEPAAASHFVFTDVSLDVVAHLHLEVAPIAAAAAPALAEEELKDLPLDLKTAGDRLSYQSSAKNYRFLHPRSWHVMDERPELTVFRMVERGELVAQCNIATPPVAKSNEPPSLEQFQKEVEKALGSNLGQIVQVAATTSPRGCVVLRVVATGQVSDLPIEWHYYLVANRNGRQVVLAFTMQQSLVERLADTDQEIVGNLEILEPTPKAAAVPTTTK